MESFSDQIVKYKIQNYAHSEYDVLLRLVIIKYGSMVCSSLFGILHTLYNWAVTQDLKQIA